MHRSFRKFLLARLVLFSGLCALAFSQTTSPKSSEPPHFEASSIKIVEFARGGGEKEDAGRIGYHQVVLSRLVSLAFDIKGYLVQLIQWPGSLPHGGLTHYDVDATFPVGTSDADRRLMLQSLLRERLAFRSHWEQRSVPVYALVVAPGGLKVQKAPPSDTVTTLKPGVGMSPTAFTLNGNLPLLDTAGDFWGYFDLPIQDETGLEGDYAIHLTVPRGEMHFGSGRSLELSPADRAEANGFDTKAFLSALERQVGLRLEKRTAAANVLVVEGVNTAPTAN